MCSPFRIPEKAFSPSPNEAILVDDIVDHYRDFIRPGEDSEVMKHSGLPSMSAFNDVFVRQINAIYKKKSIKALAPQTWPGVICQPFVCARGSR